MTRASYQRICPVCDTASAPEESLCVACGALLLGVDLSLQDDAPPPAAATEAGARCSHADCAAVNPPGSQRCLYCDRPMQAAAQQKSAGDEASGGGQGAQAAAADLPPLLAEKFSIVDRLRGAGGEAKLLLLAGRKTGVRVAAKIYQPGLQPQAQVLERVRKADLSHVARIIDYGCDDGVGYEVLEYCAGGSLRTLMDEKAVTAADLPQVVSEIGQALEFLHAAQVLHCNLKPENVLVRRRRPLDLALADLAPPCLADAADAPLQRPRNLAYAAPEMLAGVADAAADYWSFGMILLELLQGRHPFADLSDAVITHCLVTSAVAVEEVGSPEAEKLCRGLLLRDPQRRWRAAEVRRWLAGDVTLALPGRDEYDPGRRAARPYRINDEASRTLHELAASLAGNWSLARKDLVRGAIGEWALQELHDHNLVRFIQDLLDARDLSDDMRLLRLINHLAPGLPPLWRGESLAAPSVLAMAARAECGDEQARDWLLSVFNEKVLREYSLQGKPALAALAARWEGGHERCVRAWLRCSKERAEFARQATRLGDYVDFDHVVYGEHTRHEQPPRAQILAPLLLCLVDEGFAARLRRSTLDQAAPWLAANPWLQQLLQGEDVADWVMARLLAPLAEGAEKDARLQQQRRLDARAAQYRELADEIDAVLAELRQLADISLFASSATLHGALASCSRMQELTTNADALAFPADCGLMRGVRRAEKAVRRIEDVLDQWTAAAGAFAVFADRMQQWLLSIYTSLGLLVLLMALSLLLPGSILMFVSGLLVTFVAFVLWRAATRRRRRQALREACLELPPRISRRHGEAEEAAAA